jgi:hypothetical protein
MRLPGGFTQFVMLPVQGSSAKIVFGRGGEADVRAGLRQSFFSEMDRRRAIKQKKNDVAVFLDIGGTLTYANVHTAYAEVLGYAEAERSLRQRLNSG